MILRGKINERSSYRRHEQLIIMAIILTVYNLLVNILPEPLVK